MTDLLNKYSSQELREIRKAMQFDDDATIDFQSQNAPDIIKKVELDLSESSAKRHGQGKKLGWAFKSIWMYEATDSGVIVNFTPFSGNKSNDSVPMSKNGVMNFDGPVQNAFLTWDAQPGKKCTLLFILNGHFRPGSLFTEVASGVDGNAISVPNSKSVGTTPVKIADQDSNRTVLNINSDLDLLVGPTETGNFFPMGKDRVFKNTAEMWAKCLSGTATVNTLEES